jgi:hypothetical protein
MSATEIQTLLDDNKKLEDDLTFTKAQIKLNRAKINLLARRYPEAAAELGIELEGENAPKKRGRPPKTA